jgi:hypothetical protein
LFLNPAFQASASARCHCSESRPLQYSFIDVAAPCAPSHAALARAIVRNEGSSRPPQNRRRDNLDGSPDGSPPNSRQAGDNDRLVANEPGCCIPGPQHVSRRICLQRTMQYCPRRSFPLAIRHRVTHVDENTGRAVLHALFATMNLPAPLPVGTPTPMPRQAKDRLQVTPPARRLVRAQRSADNQTHVSMIAGPVHVAGRVDPFAHQRQFSSPFFRSQSSGGPYLVKYAIRSPSCDTKAEKRGSRRNGRISGFHKLAAGLKSLWLAPRSAH